MRLCYNIPMKIMRIVFCILACLCVLAAVPIGILCDVIYLVVDLFVALAFGGAMLLCKKRSEPVQRTTDYMNSEEENETIRRENEQSGKDE